MNQRNGTQAVTCAMMQPTYLPWLGYFEFIRRADVFVIYDHVQFTKASWQQRNRIRNRAGEMVLTVPILHDGGLDRPIRTVRIDHSRNPMRKHLASIQQAYSKALNFDKYFGELAAIYDRRHELLMDLNMDLIRFGMKVFRLAPKLLFSSDLAVEGKKVEALVDVYGKLNAEHGITQYYFPRGSRVYIDDNDLLEKQGISVLYQSYEPAPYQQVDHTDFISHLAFLDFIFNSSGDPFGDQ